MVGCLLAQSSAQAVLLEAGLVSAVMHWVLIMFVPQCMSIKLHPFFRSVDLGGCIDRGCINVTFCMLL